MRFLADENVPRLVIERLRSAGFAVNSVSETKSGMPDEEVLRIADTEDCILITEDRDFGELVIRQKLAVRGIVMLELDRLSSKAEADAVAALHTRTNSRAIYLLSSLVEFASGRWRVEAMLNTGNDLACMARSSAR
jgi:predicted nuclease of predicted toxin-antitoxin system